MSSVVCQNLLAQFCADRQENNDRSVVTFNSWKVWRMSTANLFHALEGDRQVNGQDGVCPSNFFMEGRPRVVPNLRTRRSASLHFIRCLLNQFPDRADVLFGREHVTEPDPHDSAPA